MGFLRIIDLEDEEDSSYGPLFWKLNLKPRRLIELNSTKRFTYIIKILGEEVERKFFNRKCVFVDEVVAYKTATNSTNAVELRHIGKYLM